jgi:flagellar hook-length control protein FliK
VAPPADAATAAAASAPQANDPDKADEPDDAAPVEPAHPSAHHTAEQPAPLPATIPLPAPVQPPTTANEHIAARDEQAAPATVRSTGATETVAAQPQQDSAPTITTTMHQPAPAAPVNAVAATAAAPEPARTVPAEVAAAVRQQLTGPLVKISQTNGEQILVVQVRPENLGPVTVHAHVRDNAVHVELFAPSDAGRDALAQVSADLRADLQQSHSGNTSLNVSSQTAPSADRDGKPRDGSPAEPRTGDRHPTGDTPGQDAQQHQPRGSNRLLDVLA